MADQKLNSSPTQDVDLDESLLLFSQEFDDNQTPNNPSPETQQPLITSTPNGSQQQDEISEASSSQESHFTQSQSQSLESHSSQGMSILQNSTLLNTYRIETQLQELKGYIRDTNDQFWLSNINDGFVNIQQMFQRHLSYHEMTHKLPQRNASPSSSSSSE
jgi:hypothetical protein